MTIDEAIKQLQSEKNDGNKHIIFAWWDASCFEREDNDDWGEICDIVERKMDWSDAHDQMTDLIALVESDTN